MKNYYQILGISEEASEQEVKSTFRKLAKKFHPDKNPDDAGAEKRFKEISEAYEVLSDSQKRQQYDYMRVQPQNPLGGFGDVFSSFFGDFTDLFNVRSTQHTQRRQHRNSDLGLAINLPFWEAINGCRKEIEFAIPVECRICNGSGAIGNPMTCPDCGGCGRMDHHQGPMRIRVTCRTCRGGGRISDACSMCDGHGYTQKQENIVITIPKGVDTGQTIRLVGKGSRVIKNAPPGNLMVELHVEQHNGEFRRSELHIHSEKNIPFTRAALGGKISVNTIHGARGLDIPRGCSDGSTLVINSGGIKTSKGIGNHYVKLRISFPPQLTPEQESLLQQLDKTL